MFKKLIVLGGLLYAGSKYFSKAHAEKPGGYKNSAASSSGPHNTAVQDKDKGLNRAKSDKWSEVDEELDQSFPASDPPANY